MAGDWLKVEIITPDKTEVSNIAHRLGMTPEEAFGRLFRVWVWCQNVSANGHVRVRDLSPVDRAAGVPGFGQAMAEELWIEPAEAGFVIPKWDRHLSKGAKKRALEAERKRKSRQEDVLEPSGSKADTKRTIEKKSSSSSLRSEETPSRGGKGKVTLPPDFAIAEETRKALVAEGYGPYLTLHFTYFVDYCISNGKRYNDFDKAFRNSVRGDWGKVRANAQRDQFKPGAKPPNGAALPGAPWYITWTGIQNEGLRRSIAKDEQESDAEFTDRVFAAAGVTRDQAARERREWTGK